MGGSFILLVLALLLQTFNFQQIFEDTSTCEIIKKNQQQSIYLKRTLWEVSGSVKQQRQMLNKVFLVSPCTPISPSKGCKPGSVACIIDSKNTQKSILNAGQKFVHDFDSDTQRDSLYSVNGQPCSDNDNFTVTIDFVCSLDAKDSPTFVALEECGLRLEMLSPDCSELPTCTTRINGNLVDLRDLKKLGTFPVHTTTGKLFLLSFCGEAKECGVAGISMCEKSNVVFPIAEHKTLSISYDDTKEHNILILKAHYGMGKKSRINTEIHLKCNWEEKGISNLKQIELQQQGKTFRFEGESSFACIKFPMNCKVIDPFNNYLVYDLTSLYNPHGFWSITTDLGVIYLNMCGPLKLPNVKNVCNAQSSQVCFKDDQNHFVNLGSMVSNFIITENDTVITTFTDGEKCLINNKESLSSTIEFLCWGKQLPPTLVSHINCSYTLTWKTPAACPKNIATQEDCLMNDILGTIDLRNISSATDATYPLSTNTFLNYNLCGVLKNNCSNNLQASICYVKDGKEFVVGYQNNKLLRYNTSLSLNLVGDKCPNSESRSKTTVFFTCSYLAPVRGNVQVRVLEKDCNFEMHVNTPLACVKKISKECRSYSNNSVYDLTALVQNDSNYKVLNSKQRNMVYYLNICRSLVPEKDLYCPEKSSACMKNSTEFHLRTMYKSIGSIQERRMFSFENDNLVLTYGAGSFCRGKTFQNAETKILFECSSKSEKLQYLDESACTYRFIWRTPHACPKRIVSLRAKRSPVTSCGKVHVKNFNIMDFEKLDKDFILTLESGEYIFDACEQNSSYCNKNGTECESTFLDKQLIYENDNLRLQYTLRNICDGKPTILQIYLVCDCSNQMDDFTIVVVDNCTIVTKYTSCIICQKEIELNLPSTSFSTITQNYLDMNSLPSVVTVPSALSVLTPLNCALKLENVTFNTKDLNFQVSSDKKNNYTVAFGAETAICHGYVCKNEDKLLEGGEGCPEARYSKESTIKLKFNSQVMCRMDKINLEILLKCKSTPHDVAVAEESDCSVIITYPMEEMCGYFVNTTNKSSSMDLWLGIPLGVFAFAILVGAIYIARYYNYMCFIRCCKTDKYCIYSKESTPIYYKDLQA